MYRKPKFEEDTSLQIKLPWDRNTARGFGISIAIVLIIFLMLTQFQLDKVIVRNLEVNSVPLTLLNFGDGDGTGMSKGNLTKEGAARKGQAAQSVLQDAVAPAQTKATAKATLDNNELSIPVPVKELSSDKKLNATDKGSGNKDIGMNSNAVSEGTGLGSRGSGRGSGYGFGDIEWGGGGNRIVLHKPLPVFPNGVNTSAELKFRFTVMPDGTVGRIIPLQKADPRLETAALNALKQWRFNVLKENVVMEGIIPLSFVLK